MVRCRRASIRRVSFPRFVTGQGGRTFVSICSKPMTRGGSVGLFDTGHRLKYPSGAAISDHPLWQLQLACGAAFCVSVFGVALLALGRARSRPQSGSWIAVAVSATMGGSLLALAIEKMLSESYGLGDWLVRGLLLVAAIVAPLQSSHALMSGRALPTFLELLGPRGDKPLSRSTMILGFTLIVTTVIATETALGLVFDPRWRDFPFAALTIIVVSFGTVAQLNGRKAATRPLAEAVFAGLFAVAALYMLFNEGFQNWQSLWIAVIYFLFGMTLWHVRSVAVVSAMAPALPIVSAEMLVERTDQRR